MLHQSDFNFARVTSHDDGRLVHHRFLPGGGQAGVRG